MAGVVGGGGGLPKMWLEGDVVSAHDDGRPTARAATSSALAAARRCTSREGIPGAGVSSNEGGHHRNGIPGVAKGYWRGRSEAEARINSWS